MARPFAGKRIGVLRGGQSSEREVSLRSGAAVAGSLKRQGYAVLELEPDPAVLTPLAGSGGTVKLDVAFIALHGRGGEDGRIQAVLEWLGVPFTGSDMLSSALGMDKVITKRLLQTDGVPTPSWQLCRRDGEAPVVGKFPVVVKPAREGSTVGITIVRQPDQLAAAVKLAERHEGDVLIEEYIDGYELTVAVLDGEPLPPIEIVPTDSFYDYAAKYTPGRSDYQLPPTHVAEATWRQAQTLAARVHRLLGCSGATRVDFRVDRAGRPFVLEINTVPGMTETSLLPKAAAAAGLDYDALVLRILASALGRAAGRP